MLKKYTAMFSMDNKLMMGLIFFFLMQDLIVSEVSQDYLLVRMIWGEIHKQACLLILWVLQIWWNSWVKGINTGAIAGIVPGVLRENGGHS